MRLVHTSDWHLGRNFFGQSLIDDQAHVLEQLFAILAGERIDLLVIAGDIYDRAVPPTEAVALFDEVLTRLQREVKVPTIIIGGNHDSADRLGFAGRLLESQGIFLRAGLGRMTTPIRIESRDGRSRCDVFATGFVEPESARALFGDDDITGHDAALRRLFAEAREHQTPGVPSVAVAHAFVRGGAESPESERPIAGGLGQVHAEVFQGFDYVALGHLHGPQKVGRGLHYSGSPLKYSFGESAHRKGVVIVDLDHTVDGLRAPHIENVILSPRRDVLRISGTLDALLEDPRWESARAAYVEATLELQAGEYVIDAWGKLSRRFAHLRAVRHEAPLPIALDPAMQASLERHRSAPLLAGRDEAALLGAFFLQTVGVSPDPRTLEVFVDTMRQVDNPEAQSVPTDPAIPRVTDTQPEQFRKDDDGSN